MRCDHLMGAAVCEVLQYAINDIIVTALVQNDIKIIKMKIK